MTGRETVAVRMFGRLRDHRLEQGLPVTADVVVSAQGDPARDVALGLGLPLELIEGVFCNHVICDLEHVIRPGDSIAFVPHGTPGPHRFFLGLYKAGRANGE